MTLLADPAILVAFVTTFLFVSATPGMCMALSFSLGMSIGVKRTLAMMWGELVGVGFVTILCGYGAASIMKHAPQAFTYLKVVGGAYLIYIAYTMWRGATEDINTNTIKSADSNRSLATQGFITAVSNPKAWAFMSTVLLPFISPNEPLTPQLITLVIIILIIEFLSLILYALVGQSIQKLVVHNNRALLTINRVAAACIAAIGIWLAFG